MKIRSRLLIALIIFDTRSKIIKSFSTNRKKITSILTQLTIESFQDFLPTCTNFVMIFFFFFFSFFSRKPFPFVRKTYNASREEKRYHLQSIVKIKNVSFLFDPFEPCKKGWKFRVKKNCFFFLHT